ncbi:hypothetical protein LTR85_003868 [Meristemomyces frigidus]|nr:hypothetical protein LTR85_003868 [Meristemomyces frigidus]
MEGHCGVSRSVMRCLQRLPNMPTVRTAGVALFARLTANYNRQTAITERIHGLVATFASSTAEIVRKKKHLDRATAVQDLSARYRETALSIVQAMIDSPPPEDRNERLRRTQEIRARLADIRAEREKELAERSRIQCETSEMAEELKRQQVESIDVQQRLFDELRELKEERQDMTRELQAVIAVPLA